MAVLCLGAELSVVASALVRSGGKIARRAESRALCMPKRATGARGISTSIKATREDYARRKQLGLLTEAELISEKIRDAAYEKRELAGDLTPEELDYARRKRSGLLTDAERETERAEARTYHIREMMEQLTPKELADKEKRNKQAEKAFKDFEQAKEQKQQKEKMSLWGRFVRWLKSSR